MTTPATAAQAPRQGLASARLNQFLGAHAEGMTMAELATQTFLAGLASASGNGGGGSLGGSATPSYLYQGSYAQPFTTAAGTGQLLRVDLALQLFGEGADVAVQIQTDSAGKPSGTVVASATIPASLLRDLQGKPGASYVLPGQLNSFLLPPYPNNPFGLASDGNYLWLLGNPPLSANQSWPCHYLTLNADGGVPGSLVSTEFTTVNPRLFAGGNASNQELVRPTWQPTTPLNNPFSNRGFLYVNGGILAVGGSSGGSSQSLVDGVVVNADGTLAQWTPTTALPAALDSATLVADSAGQYLYVLGGNNGGPLNSVYSAPLTGPGYVGNWTQQTSLPISGTHPSAFYADGYLYVGGGYNSTAFWYNGPTWFRAPASNGSVGSWTPVTTENPGASGSGWGGASAYWSIGSHGAIVNNCLVLGGSGPVQVAQLYADGNLGGFAPTNTEFPTNPSWEEFLITSSALFGITGNSAQGVISYQPLTSCTLLRLPVNVSLSASTRYWIVLQQGGGMVNGVGWVNWTDNTARAMQNTGSGWSTLNASGSNNMACAIVNDSNASNQSSPVPQGIWEDSGAKWTWIESDAQGQAQLVAEAVSPATGAAAFGSARQLLYNSDGQLASVA